MIFFHGILGKSYLNPRIEFLLLQVDQTVNQQGTRYIGYQSLFRTPDCHKEGEHKREKKKDQKTQNNKEGFFEEILLISRFSAGLSRSGNL